MSDVADEYGRYVDRIAPAGHELARVTARHFEFATFLLSTSFAQESLSKATEGITAYARFLPLVKTHAGRAGQDETAFKEKLGQLMVVDQMIELRSTVATHYEEHRRVA